MLAWAGTKRPRVDLIPDHAIPVTVLGYAVAPVYGAGNQVQILQYQVRANWACLITSIVFAFQGALPAPLPGDITWCVDIDRPLGSTAGYFEKDYGQVQLSLGSLQMLPWPVRFRHRNGEIIRVKGYTNQNVSTGAGNFLTAALIGYEWTEDTGL